MFCSYDYDGNGAKLMEHSYYHNRFVEAALAMLAPNWRRDKKPLRAWWIGDYADESDIPEDKKKYKPIESTWNEGVTLKVVNESFDFSKPCYLVNESTHEYIDLLRLEKINRGSCGGMPNGDWYAKFKQYIEDCTLERLNEIYEHYDGG